VLSCALLLLLLLLRRDKRGSRIMCTHTKQGKKGFSLPPPMFWSPFETPLTAYFVALAYLSFIIVPHTPLFVFSIARYTCRAITLCVCAMCYVLHMYVLCAMCWLGMSWFNYVSCVSYFTWCHIRQAQNLHRSQITYNNT
jgi:hypothetical protein